jgi:hypothetical protein
MTVRSLLPIAGLAIVGSLGLGFPSASAQPVYLDPYVEPYPVVVPPAAYVAPAPIVAPGPIVRERVVVSRPAYVASPVYPAYRAPVRAYDYAGGYTVTDWW